MECASVLWWFVAIPLTAIKPTTTFLKLKLNTPFVFIVLRFKDNNFFLLRYMQFANEPEIRTQIASLLHASSAKFSQTQQDKEGDILLSATGNSIGSSSGN